MELQTSKQAVVKFIKDEEGLTIVEYAVAGGVIVLGVLAAFQGVRDGVIAVLGRIRTVLTAAAA